MDLLNKLIREIEELPTTQVCSVCIGKGNILNHKRQRFVAKYTQDSLCIDSKFEVAEKAWHEASKPTGEELLILFLDVGLSEEEAEDFHLLYLAEQETEECHNCRNGRELTEHGLLVAKLQNALFNG
jgi:hypothetical protein